MGQPRLALRLLSMAPDRITWLGKFLGVAGWRLIGALADWLADVLAFLGVFSVLRPAYPVRAVLTSTTFVCADRDTCEHRRHGLTTWILRV